MNRVIVFVHDQSTIDTVLEAFRDIPEIDPECVDDLSELQASLSQSKLILTDLLHPEAKGSNFLKWLHSLDSNSSVPVIILTSSRNEEFAVKAIRDGASSYVPSRLVATELLETVKSVLAVSYAHENRVRVIECMTTWSNTFQLSNDRTLIPPLVRYLQDTTSQMGILQGSSGGETRIAVALEEALLNGMYHGNLEVDSSLRELDDSRFYELVETRRSIQPYCDRRLHVSANFDRDRAEFIIRDEGPGFDVSTVPDPTDAVNVERVCGRGMLLMRAFMDEVTYNEIGNQVRLVKWRVKTN